MSFVERCFSLSQIDIPSRKLYLKDKKIKDERK